MTAFRGSIDDFGVGMRSLHGPLDLKLQALRDVGFAQCMLSMQEVVNHPAGADAAIAAVRASGLRVSCLGTLTDFEGLAGVERQFKTTVAKSMLEMCDALGCRKLLVRSSTLPHASTAEADIVRDLRRLAMMAVPLNIQIVYCASPQGVAVNDYLRAWDFVCDADMPNLGLGLDSEVLTDFMAEGGSEDLDMLDTMKVFLVLLADHLWPTPTPTSSSAGAADQSTSSHFEVFPGEGACAESIAALVRQLHAMAYRGDYGLDASNPDYAHMPLARLVTYAKRAALWMGEDVLRRSVPLPNRIRLKQKVA